LKKKEKEKEKRDFYWTDDSIFFSLNLFPLFLPLSFPLSGLASEKILTVGRQLLCSFLTDI
jgi:hypothetical protein